MRRCACKNQQRQLVRLRARVVFQFGLPFVKGKPRKTGPRRGRFRARLTVVIPLYTADGDATNEAARMDSRRSQDNVSIEDGTNLFNPNLLERVANQLKGDGLVFRPLNSRDYDRGFLQLLGQLTEVGNVTKDQFLNRFYGMKNSGGYYVIVVEDLNYGKVIGSATLVVEQKFIHNCGLRGHLEDVVVSSEYRGKQLGKLVVMAVKQLSKSLQCYKITLECKDRLIPFYESLGFKREPGNANSMHARFPHGDPAEQSRL